MWSALALLIICTEAFTFYSREPEIEEFDLVTEKNTWFFTAAGYTSSVSVGPASQSAAWNPPPIEVSCKQQQHVRLATHEHGIVNQ